MFSPNIQNQHKVFLKLCRLLDSLFEAISLQAKNITQLLIRFIGKQAGNGSFPTLDHCRPGCRRVVIPSIAKLNTNIQLI